MHAHALRSLVPILVLVFTGLAACSSTGGTSGSRAPTRITAEEFERSPDADAYDVVERFRPSWLRPRGTISVQNPSGNLPVVYVDGVRRGGLSELESIPVAILREIRFISAGDATTRYGTGHAAGVIEVVTRR